MPDTVKTAVTHATSRPLRRSFFARERGVGLIEVLVAVLVLSLGLLGMAGLQANALKANQSSYGRSQAVMLSYYMLDVLRADRVGAIALNYNMPSTCSPDAVATADLSGNSRKHWLQSMRNTLGDTDDTCGAISCDAAGVCTVTIVWDDSRAGGLGNQTFTTSSRL
ncbi:type IV pilus modification protein PilV [Hydrogenophaga sp. YM1]|jgi:type IV pilus assembly protein PilV|uniref:type IV pilus modification protein PilV n=1 Tax=Hydrogenophaga TaxID=47420 RepID=UPI00111307C9|nr:MULTISPECIES: type IV pilus modification protein PilV [unclassified Hydrogenophaga]MBN9372452.1 type IV pilus modification protein PilV [Hydrogenophaga sp.]QRR33026.1 type IV pilus modification protein PilV [Hydrogenophaga sp. YM1]